MIRKIKFGKIAIVIFLTILIWVWTDLDLDEVHTVPRAVITVAHSPGLLVSFNGQPEALINNIKLKGPAKKISEVRRRLDDGSLELDFSLNPELEKMNTTDSHTLKVLDFLRKSDEIKEKELRGLTVEKCEPEKIDVNVVKLVKQSLDIECFDENGTPLVGVKSIDPPKVEMYVPEDSRLKAQVQLTARDITQARLSVAVVTPYVELAPGRRRNASRTVNIKMSPEADSLIEYPIAATLGITLSKNLLGRYNVDVTNYNDLVSFFIFATQAAKDAYESQDFPITLIIRDDAANKPDEEQRRDVVYHFPEEFVRKNEIRLKNPPKQAKFKLIPLSPAKTPPAGAN